MVIHVFLATSRRRSIALGFIRVRAPLPHSVAETDISNDHISHLKSNPSVHCNDTTQPWSILEHGTLCDTQSLSQPTVAQSPHGEQQSHSGCHLASLSQTQNDDDTMWRPPPLTPHVFVHDLVRNSMRSLIQSSNLTQQSQCPRDLAQIHI